jgi:hypothetical protein
MPDPENIPSEFKDGNWVEFMLYNDSEYFGIGVEWYEDSFGVYCWDNYRGYKLI